MINDTSIYLYNFYGNWISQDKSLLSGITFENLYLGDMDYKHYNYFIDFDDFLKDNVIFALLSEDKCGRYDEVVELLQECNNFVTCYDASQYAFKSDTDEMVLEGDRKTMFVFKLTDKYQAALEQFKQSKFSKMYDVGSIKSLFSNHQDYFIKYTKGATTIKVDLKNVEPLLEKIILSEELKNFKFSYFHILNKTPELKTLLEKIFSVNLNTDSELKSKLKFEKEIYNYERVMNEELLT